MNVFEGRPWGFTVASSRETFSPKAREELDSAWAARPLELVEFRGQTALLIGLAEEAGFELRSPREPERRGGTVTLYLPEFEAVQRALGEREIICDFRPGAGIRLGPHFFTTDEELEYALRAMSEIVASGAHRRFAGAAARF